MNSNALQTITFPEPSANWGIPIGAVLVDRRPASNRYQRHYARIYRQRHPDRAPPLFGRVIWIPVDTTIHIALETSHQ